MLNHHAAVETLFLFKMKSLNNLIYRFNYPLCNVLSGVDSYKLSGIDAISFLDISTGEFLSSHGNLDYIKNLLQSFDPKEILISKKNSSQKVKNVVNYLKKSKIPEGHSHTKVYRPWGHYLSVIDANRWQVKLIIVKPGEKLSLQMHHHRSEHWVVVSGTAKVEAVSYTHLTLPTNREV